MVERHYRQPAGRRYLGDVPRPAPGRDIPNGLVVVLALSCGLAAANLYYAQPLLDTLARAFHATPAVASLLVTVAQVGYALGLAFVVPLGDILRRRVLVPAVLLLTAAALGASALAPSIGVLIALALVIGLGSVAAQVLVPLAASLASEERRGQVIGSVMTGLLLGILLARTASGLIAGAVGWRAVYWVATGLILAVAGLLAVTLPEERRTLSLSYRELLVSTLVLLHSHPLLRRRMALGAAGFGAFSVFWTTAAFLLAGPPFHYSETVIGLFGLVGAAGALCANVAGRATDRGHTSLITAVFAGALLLAFVVLAVGRHSLAGIIVGTVILDVGVQGLQIANQAVVYALAPEARSRVNANYMVAYFVGGAISSAVAGSVYAAAGWLAVCALGAATGLTALGVWVFDRLHPVVMPLATRADHELAPATDLP